MWLKQIDATIVPIGCCETGPGIPLNYPHASFNEIAFWAQERLSQFSYPNITISSNANIERYLAAFRYNDDGYSASSTAMSHLTCDLGDILGFASSHNVSFAKFARPKIKLSLLNEQNPNVRPLVQVKCGTPQDTNNREAPDMTFPTTNLSAPAFPKIVRQVNTSDFRARSPTFAFKDTSKEAGRPTLGALVGMSFSNAKDIPGSSFEMVW